MHIICKYWYYHGMTPIKMIHRHKKRLVNGMTG